MGKQRFVYAVANGFYYEGYSQPEAVYLRKRDAIKHPQTGDELAIVRLPIIGATDDRLSVAERRVVEAAVATWPHPTKETADALGSAIEALQRAKGGGNG